MTNRKIEYWVVPPESDAEFVANMEEVLETSSKPYDPAIDYRLRAETSAWSSDVNDTQRGVDWQMKIDDARCKLKSVYPKIKL